MANVRVRPFSTFFNGKKLGQMHTAKITLASGDEPQFGDGGFLGMSDGAATTTLTCTAIQPATKQLDVDLVAALQGKQDLDVVVGAIGPNLISVTVRCTKAEFDTDQKTGRLEGNFEFMGGEFKRT
jgi:hypothetical protein